MKETSTEARIQNIWLARIEREEKAHKKYRDRARAVEEVFRADLDSDVLHVPLYWSVVGVEHVGVYSNQPNPDVRPRNEIRDPVNLSVAELIQRGLDYVVDHYSFDTTMHRSVDDYLAMGLGTMRVKVDSMVSTELVQVPIYGQDPMGNPLQVGTRPEENTQIGDQIIRWEYVPWARFGWEPGNSWKHVDWIYFRHRMTQLQIRERFGRTVKASKDEHDTGDINDWKQKTFDIYEVWDKKKKRVLFIAKGESEPLELRDDPLGLLGFFPVPQPMMTNLNSEELIPQPDYDYIESYDVELNRLHERRMALLEQIKASGAYEKGLPELGQMVENEDGQYMPIQNLLQRINAAGGVDNIIYHLPIMEKSQVLAELTSQIQFVKAQVDEILGISDIVRGVTTASESATAQEIKGRWVGVRLTRKRECVQYTIREMLRISAQLLVSHITPENLSRMTQMPITEQMMQILNQDLLMEFMVDIETDSTIAKDEFKERAVYQEMLNGVAQFAQTVMPLVQQNAMDANISSAILSAALRPYSRYDRNLEESLSAMPTSQQQLQQLNQQLGEMNQQLQQAQGAAQQWQSIAETLQMQATEAKSQKEAADARLKEAQRKKVLVETADKAKDLESNDLDDIEQLKDIQYKDAQRRQIDHNIRSGGNGSA
jgi:hypothetical protein